MELKLEDNHPGLRVMLRFPRAAQPPKQLPAADKTSESKPATDKTLAAMAAKLLPGPDASGHDGETDKRPPAEAA